jgi:CBS domain-containing protein
MRAADVMTTTICAANPDAPIDEIARKLLEWRVSALPVIDEDDHVLGIVSEGDLMRHASLGTDRRSWWLDILLTDTALAKDYVKTHGRIARDVMTSPALVVEENADLTDVARLLESKRIKRVPVVRDGRLVGIVSRADIMRGLIAAGEAWNHPRTADDTSVRETVLGELRKLPFAVAAHVNAIVDDGIVHLWGHVESPEQRAAIRIAAERVDGVRRVVDHMVDWRMPAYI